MVGRIGEDQVEDYARRKGMPRRGREVAGAEPRVRSARGRGDRGRSVIEPDRGTGRTSSHALTRGS